MIRVIYSVLGRAVYFSPLCLFSFIPSVKSMYLIYRKHKLCRSLVVWWWFGGFGFRYSSRCDRGCCLVTLSQRLSLTGCTWHPRAVVVMQTICITVMRCMSTFLGLVWVPGHPERPGTLTTDFRFGFQVPGCRLQPGALPMLFGFGPGFLATLSGQEH